MRMRARDKEGKKKGDVLNIKQKQNVKEIWGNNEAREQEEVLA